jgi:hypothetical protein
VRIRQSNKQASRGNRVRTAILLSLIALPICGIAQTVTILSISATEKPDLGSRSVGVEVSMLNDKKAPIVLNNRFFYLADDHETRYLSLYRMNKSDISFNVELNPGSKLSQQLWFDVPSAIDLHSLRLCLHASENESWDDYLEIPFTLPTPATAPMWHLATSGNPVAPMGYLDPTAMGRVPGFTPPTLSFAPDPKLPPGGAEHMKARGKIVSIVSLISIARVIHSRFR